MVSKNIRKLHLQKGITIYTLIQIERHLGYFSNAKNDQHSFNLFILLADFSRLHDALSVSVGEHYNMHQHEFSSKFTKHELHIASDVFSLTTAIRVAKAPALCSHTTSCDQQIILHVCLSSIKALSCPQKGQLYKVTL